ncbi:MAG: hypothetical protein MK135_16235 [Polyangiaceae bacterium]|nr:hypothetical protein [Polyangiaceae bacterium]
MSKPLLSEHPVEPLVRPDWVSQPMAAPIHGTPAPISLPQFLQGTQGDDSCLDEPKALFDSTVPQANHTDPEPRTQHCPTIPEEEQEWQREQELLLAAVEAEKRDLRAATEELRNTVIELREAAKQKQRKLETECVFLIKAASERIIERELKTDEDTLFRLVTSGMSTLTESEQLTLEVGPALEEQLDGLDSKQELPPQLILKSRQELLPYACRLTTQYGSVEEGIESRSKRLWESFNRMETER